MNTNGPRGLMGRMRPQGETGMIASIADLIAGRGELVVKKEDNDKLILRTLTAPSREQFRARLLQWASVDFTPEYEIATINVTPPPVCADGVTRGLGDYVAYLSGKTVEQLCADMQALMSGITVSYKMTNAIKLFVTKV